jgi:hypothetical protein
MKRVEIENIIGYIDFVKDKVGLAEQSSLTESLKELTKEITPATLGSINRTHSLVRKLTRNLLRLHHNKLDEKHINDIIKHITEKLYSHTHLINRREAKVIGFESVIEYPNKKTQRIIEKLYVDAKKTFQINKVFNPVQLIGAADKKDISVARALIHSEDLKYNFISHYTLTKAAGPGGEFNVNVNEDQFISRWYKI